MDQLLAFGKDFGLQGLLFVLVILVLVAIGRKSGLVATGDHARAANVILSAILFGLGSDPSAETALMSAIASILAALSYQGIQYIQSKTQLPPAG